MRCFAQTWDEQRGRDFEKKCIVWWCLILVVHFKNPMTHVLVSMFLLKIGFISILSPPRVGHGVLMPTRTALLDPTPFDDSCQYTENVSKQERAMYIIQPDGCQSTGDRAVSYELTVFIQVWIQNIIGMR